MRWSAQVAIILAAAYVLRLISAVLRTVPRDSRHRKRPRPAARRARNRRAPDRATAVPVCLAGGDHGRGDRMIAAVERPPVDWFALAPELSLLAAAGICLLVAVLVPARASRRLPRSSAPSGSSPPSCFAVLLYDRSPDGESFIGGVIRRPASEAMAALIVAGVGFVAVWIAIAEPLKEHVAEFYALLTAAAAGMIFLAHANSLMTLFLGARVVLDLAVHPVRDRPRAGALAGGGPEIPDRRRVRVRRAPLRLRVVYGATGELQFEKIADAVGTQNWRTTRCSLFGLAMILSPGSGSRSRQRRSTCGRPMSTRAPPDAGDRVHVGRDQGRRADADAARAVHGVPAKRRAFWDDRGCSARLRVARGREPRRAGPDSCEAPARVLLDLARGVHADRDRLAQRARAKALVLLPDPLLGDVAGRVRRRRGAARRARPRRTLENLAGMGWERPLLGASMWAFMLGFAGCRRPAASSGVLRLLGGVRPWLALARHRRIAATAVSLYYYLAVIRALYIRPSAELQFAPAASRRGTSSSTSACGVFVVTVGSFFAGSAAARPRRESDPTL